jgi:hypothetical protein
MFCFYGIFTYFSEEHTRSEAGSLVVTCSAMCTDPEARL